VSSCTEVTSPDDPRSKYFVYGRYDRRKGRFVYDYPVLKVLLNRSVGNIKRCQNCMAKYTCAGDCPAKVLGIGKDLYDPKNSYRCKITREILKHRILSEA
jgi:uncharacterized protein